MFCLQACFFFCLVIIIIFIISFFCIVISAIAVINEAIDKGDHNCTLQALQVEAAKLSGTTPDNSQLYQKVLYAQKTAKAEVREQIRNLYHENNSL